MGLGPPILPILRPGNRVFRVWGRAVQSHALYASDEGFDFKSKVLDDLYGWHELEPFDVELDEDVDTFTDKIPIRNAVKIASYEGPPSEMGNYVGFVPSEDEEEDE